MVMNVTKNLSNYEKRKLVEFRKNITEPGKLVFIKNNDTTNNILLVSILIIIIIIIMI